ncbi:MAG: hypothetical protein KAG37_05540 [Flavobacteriales bacterium]|nr:hypothetical protein [Flavobacteriales bacterium]
MKLLAIFTLFFLTLFVFVNCGSISKTEVGSQAHLKDVASECLSGKVEFLYNSDSTYVVCVGNRTKFGQTFSFFVYSFKTKDSVSEMYNNVSEAKWDGADKVKFRYLAGNTEHGRKNVKFTTIIIKD